MLLPKLFTEIMYPCSALKQDLRRNQTKECTNAVTEIIHRNNVSLFSTKVGPKKKPNQKECTNAVTEIIHRNNVSLFSTKVGPKKKPNQRVHECCYRNYSQK